MSERAFYDKKSIGLVSAPFLAALLLFFAGSESLVKNFLTELYRNLTVEVLSSDNYWVIEFQALADLCADINGRLANSIFHNHKRARPDMKKRWKQQKIWFFYNDHYPRWCFS